jgi:predicted nucleic acid-binding Zn ribbon protein
VRRGSSDDGNARPIGESLDRLAKSLGVPGSSVLSSVFTKWDELVGAGVSAHAWPLSLSRGVLVVGVDQPAWATQLRFLAPELVRRLGAALPDGAIERVEVKVQPERPSGA